MLEVLYATGLRVSELVKMRLRDVNFDAGYLITFGKGRKERLVPVGEAALASVRAYVEGTRPTLLHGKALDTLFVTHHGRAMTRQGFWKLLGRYARRRRHPQTRSRRTSCGTRSRPTWSNAAPTCAPCRRCSATPTSARPRSTRTSHAGTCGPSTTASTRAPDARPTTDPLPSPREAGRG